MHRKQTNPYLLLMRTSRLLSVLRHNHNTFISTTSHEPFSSLHSKLQIPHYQNHNSSSYTSYAAKLGVGIRGIATCSPTSKLRCLVSVHCSDRDVSLLGPFSFDNSNPNCAFRRNFLTRAKEIKNIEINDYHSYLGRIYHKFTPSKNSRGRCNISCAELKSHAKKIVGAFWYLLAVERHDMCWTNICEAESACHMDFLYCANQHTQGYGDWKKISNGTLESKCSNEDEEKSSYTEFSPKLCYCLWWGLKILSTLGQGFQTSTYPGEILFSIALAIFGLILFALLIGNMQTYLQSLTIRLEEMRIKRRDSEQWMHHRLLPQDLRERVRRYDQYKWLETRGVDEESLVQTSRVYRKTLGGISSGTFV